MQNFVIVNINHEVHTTTLYHIGLKSQENIVFYNQQKDSNKNTRVNINYKIYILISLFL